MQRHTVIGPLPEPLDAYLVTHRDGLRRQLHVSGALLFRQSGCDSPEAFARLVRCFAPALMRENGEHVALGATEHIYTPVLHAPEQKLVWHNENSFNADWPDIIAFRSVRPADRGGETLLVDSRAVLAAIDPDVVAEFRAKGVCYVRTMGLGVGLDWRQVLQVSTAAQAEQHCRSRGIAFRWLDDDVLQTRSIRPAVESHAVTGEDCWFNQAQHWHPWFLGADVRQELRDAFGDEALPRDCRFGDGSAIDDDVMDHINTVYERLEWSVPLAAGDVLVVDNVLLAHGRNPYAGPRELHVAMGRYVAEGDSV
ncbi:TauD/TfdA family dioxygenase [Tahibacter amnicola]|uniref:TauD/TfdA family dioxygenase n=1 Tax=Tahibacter amnicola TaxID=2976241 RepID=A0ABY6BED5_9GAMM|nr:TauD/TfdA family dioxygenase [Tahibacter amnicola]UXI66267.1 TauD/TfdA family dioxygenase [Tahibacter amnicola]